MWIQESPVLTSLDLRVGSVGKDVLISQNPELASLADVALGSVGTSLAIELKGLASLEGLQVGSVGGEFKVVAPSMKEVPEGLEVDVFVGA